VISIDEYPPNRKAHILRPRPTVHLLVVVVMVEQTESFSMSHILFNEQTPVIWLKVSASSNE